MSLTPSCKLAEDFAMICAVFFTKSSPRFRSTLTINQAFSVAHIESPRIGGPSLWRTIIPDASVSVLP